MPMMAAGESVVTRLPVVFGVQGASSQINLIETKSPNGNVVDKSSTNLGFFTIALSTAAVLLENFVISLGTVTSETGSDEAGGEITSSNYYFRWHVKANSGYNFDQWDRVTI